jgi:bacterial/archaeal transporter family-2 protein
MAINRRIIRCDICAYHGYAVPKIGVATTIVSVIMGQVLMSLVIDHFGFFGGRQIPFNWHRGIAVVLLGVSLFLIYKR